MVNMTPFKKTSTLSEELTNIQSVFKTALTRAQTLASKISAKKDETNAKIAELNAELVEIDKVQQNTTTFITNLEKFVLSE